jgi:hypothetical protein
MDTTINKTDHHHENYFNEQVTGNKSAHKGLYEKYILPQVIHFVCGLKPMMKQRQKIVPQATGRVLEIGAEPAFL